MRDNSSRRGAADLGTPLMIVAFLVIGGFLFWLYRESEAEEQLRMQEAAEETARIEAEERRSRMLVDAQAIQMDASPWEGDTIIVEEQAVASSLGSQGFWMEMPNGNPFLISLSDGVKQESLSLQNGQGTTVTGVVTAMNDSILTAWTESGAIAEGDRLAAEFATHFIEASDVELVELPPEPAADSTAADSTGTGAQSGA